MKKFFTLVLIFSVKTWGLSGHQNEVTSVPGEYLVKIKNEFLNTKSLKMFESSINA